MKNYANDDKVMSTAVIYKTTTVIVSEAKTMLTGYIFQLSDHPLQSLYLHGVCDKLHLVCYKIHSFLITCQLSRCVALNYAYIPNFSAKTG